MGEWIEILKKKCLICKKKLVSPFMGEWIEIATAYLVTYSRTVSPFMGEWIER